MPVRRILPTQAAATFTRATIGSTLTPMRSAPANPAQSCCAPVRPGLARPAEAPRGVDDSSLLVYSQANIGYSRATIGIFTGYFWGTHGVLTYPSSGFKEALDTPHGLDAHGLSDPLESLL
jgi:hypothetical protein